MFAEDAKVDFRWLDAGWYSDPEGNTVPTDSWGTVGSWELDPEKWPGDTLLESVEFAHANDMKTLMWFEPERVTHPEALAKNYGYAPQKFADAVAAAALETNEITLLLNGDDITRLRVGQAIETMLEAGGLKVTIVKSTAETLEENLKKRHTICISVRPDCHRIWIFPHFSAQIPH